MFPNVPACSGFYRRPRILGYSDTDQVLRKHVDENDRKSYPVKTTGQVGHPTSFPGFSPTRPMERERERPWKTLVTWFRNKIISEGGVLCLTFLCLVYSRRSHSDRNSKIDLPTLLQL